MPTTALKERWRGSAGQDRAREALSRLLSGGDLNGLGLGSVDGRVDLRGLWLVSPDGLPEDDQRPGTLIARGVAITAVDLSGGTLPINTEACTVTDVRFDRVGWQGWESLGSRFIECTFRRADLRDGGLDGRNPGLQDRPLQHAISRYERCDFTRTRTGPYGGLGRAVFDHCRFTDTAFPSPMWTRGASFIGCTFHGSYRSLYFGWTGPTSEAAPMLEDVDVRDATFDELGLGVYQHRGSGLITTPGQLDDS